jgi:uncharacterized protein
MTQTENPFLLIHYLEAQYFCDRVAETNLLCQHIKNGKNTTLFSIRRLGKTGLIYRVFDVLSKNKKIAALYVDIYSTSSLKEFTNTLATAIYNKFPERRGIGKKIIDAIKALRPVISYDGFTGSPEVSLDFAQPKQYEKTIQQLFQFLDEQEIKIVFAIDEFQQILEYPEKNVESILRTYIQPLKNINFIFCGSNQKMMHEIFNNAKRPFFASCSNMHLDKISDSNYADFILTHFNNSKKNIDAASIANILTYTQSHTYYTQYLCNKIFASGQKKIDNVVVNKICNDILLENEYNYFQYKNLLTNQQWKLLTAIAKEEKADKLHTKEFFKKYDLGTSSSVTRALAALIDKEMIYLVTDDVQKYYCVYDKFLMRWLQRN